MRHVRTLMLALLCALVSCEHDPALVSSGAYDFQSAILDGASGGNPNFFFLPPMGRDPGARPAGSFDASLAPEVVVCAWTGSGCGAEIARYTTTSGVGSETVRLNVENQHYLVSWHTNGAGLDPATTYRIKVLVDGNELGFADVDIVQKANELQQVPSGFVGLVNGRTLPIKFRIEFGGVNTPPVVTITAPADGASFEAGTSITFTATASDVEDGNLSTAIVWSSDLAGSLGTGASLSTAALAEGTHVITASVTDSHGATRSAQHSVIVTPVRNTAPTVDITAPVTGAMYPFAAPVTFTGTATDAEDGDLSGQIRWSSNRDGEFGSGASLTTASLSGGTHVITATVTDSRGSSASTAVTVVMNILTVQKTLDVPYGQTASLPITLTMPAPAGGITIVVTSDASEHVSVLTPTVTIPAGALAANATLQGAKPGTAVVTVSHPTYGADASNVTTTANLNIVQSSIRINTASASSMQIQLESVGSGIAAPIGGMVVTLTATDPGCVAVPSTVTIPQGSVDMSAPVTYGGTTMTPCNTIVTASATNVTPDNVPVFVDPAPAIMLSPAVVGAGLQVNASGSLATGTHGGVTVHLVSSDPSVMLLAPNATSAGAAAIDVVVPNGQSSVSYFVQGIEGVSWQTATVTASAPAFQNGTTSVEVRPAAFDIIGMPATTTSLSPNQAFMVRVGYVISRTDSRINSEQARRAGGSALTATLTNSNAAAAQLATSAATGQSVTVNIAPGQSRSPSTRAAGGVEFDPLGGGTTTLTAAIAGLVAAPNAVQSVTVSAPKIVLLPATVGAGLQVSVSGSLEASSHGGITIRLESSDPTVMLLAPNATTAGTASIDISVPNGQTFFSYVVQGVEGASWRTATVTASSPAFQNGVGSVQVRAAGYDIIGLSSTTTTHAVNQAFMVRVGYVISQTDSRLNAEQAVRVGGSALTATVTNSNATIAQLVTSAATGQSVTVTISVGSARSPSSLATGGVSFDPLAAGSTMVRASIPGLVAAPNSVQTVTVAP